MKFIKNYIMALMICLAMFLVSCNYQIVPITPAIKEPVKPRFHFGNYETGEMRKIWGACYTAMMQRNPYAPPEPVGAMCDCYVDELRETHSQTSLKELTKIENDAMGKQLIAKCNGKPLGSAKKMFN